ncbi:pilus assembly protein TadE [Massilia litorea]|uniref:Pilus assembly protein TadE n=2 Tax=Massilia litorea TaxID=2769491 RepID=A0A7L9U0A1_9BURK|nr:pilus assembly protein TadE [Massilia litorea]
MLGFWSLAVDIGQIYNRKVDLYGIAKAAALAAARELDGTPAGLVAARNAASVAVANLRYRNYGSGTAFTWHDDALSFGTTSSRTGTWVTSAGAAQAAELFFARVDTAGLDPAISEVETFFIRILDSSLAKVQLSDSAIAGRTSVKAMPIGVCAMSPDAAAARPATSSSGATLSELVQYGFRRGISYDLMKLNPNNTTPARFAINPVSEPGTNSQAFDIPALAPFVCSGSMWIRRITGSPIRVSELPDTSPLASLSTALNTRFDTYANTSCAPSSASPDINIKSYAYDQAGIVKWMSPNKGTPAVATTTARGKIEPVIDLPAPPATPGEYGPLWAYAKAAKAPSPVTSPEPPGGYPTFSHTDWPTLYPSGPTSSNYPTSPPVPYLSSTTASGYYQAPSLANRPMAVPHRRVLNIPLLSCSPSAPSGANAPATVVAIGKFFMTVPATDNSLIAEFAGLIPLQSLPGHVELFP